MRSVSIMSKCPIHLDHKPQVLLFGNGINRLAERDSWDDLLIHICNDEKIRRYLRSGDEVTPMSVKAYLAANGNILDALQKYTLKNGGDRNILYGEASDPTQRELIAKLLSIKFDAILTTNYTYELESVGLDVIRPTTYRLEKICRSTEEKIDQKYLLHTYNKLDYKGSTQRIFHIHGESRKPGSIVLGSNNYERLLKRIIDISDRRGKEGFSGDYDDEYTSWVEMFIRADVYAIGFGFDFAENDLWWLLERKAKEKADHGKLICYGVQDREGSFNSKNKLFDMMGYEVKSLGYYQHDSDNLPNEVSYINFYKEAIDDIEKRVKAVR